MYIAYKDNSYHKGTIQISVNRNTKKIISIIFRIMILAGVSQPTYG